MIAYAQAEFNLGRREGNITLRAHYKLVEKARRCTVPELHPVPPPAELAHIWSWFGELNAARQSSGFGANPISYQEMEAWARLTGRQPAHREVILLRRIDQAYMVVDAEESRKKPPTQRPVVTVSEGAPDGSRRRRLPR